MPVVSLPDCCSECPDGVTLRHNGAIVGSANCSGCECCGVTLDEVSALITQALAGAQGGCSDQPTYVNCDGLLLPQTIDSLGNPVVRVCPDIPSPKTYSLSVDGGPPADCCTIPDHNGTMAIDTDAGCVTHVCSGGTWFPFCGSGDGGGGVDPVKTKVCYDLSCNTTGQYCFGDAPTGWLINGLNAIDITCPGEQVTTVTQTAYPQTVLVNNAYNNFQGDPPPQGQLAGLLAGAVDSGQGAGVSTTIEVSGEPTSEPWFGSPRPIVFVDFAMGADCVGPFSVRFDTLEASGNVGFALWDSNTDTLLDVTNGGAVQGSQLTYHNIPGYGDWIEFDTSNGVVGIHEFFYNNSTGVAGDGVYMVFNALGGTADDPVEAINDISLNYQVQTTVGGGGCCECDTSLAGLAQRMNLADFNSDVDGNQIVWNVDGSTICAEMDPALVARYGALTLCESVSQPNGACTPIDVTDPPPVFTSVPSGTTCADPNTTLCADCLNGTVTFRYRPVGSTIWTDLP